MAPEKGDEEEEAGIISGVRSERRDESSCLLGKIFAVQLLVTVLLAVCTGCVVLALKVNSLENKLQNISPQAMLQEDSLRRQQAHATAQRKQLRVELEALRASVGSQSAEPVQLTEEQKAALHEGRGDAVQDVASLLLRQTDSGGMVSKARKLMTLQLSLKALMEGVEGDFFETGVYNGGTAVLMGRVLAIYAPDRWLWAADSFRGLPVENMGKEVTGPSGGVAGSVVRENTGAEGQYKKERPVIEENLQKFKLSKVHILEGWFKDTLPEAKVKKKAFLRADGDIYDSTKQAMEYLYAKVSIGGYAYFDDYGSFLGCRRAVDEFRLKHNITEPMLPVYEDPVKGTFEAVWWQKRRQPESLQGNSR